MSGDIQVNDWVRLRDDGLGTVWAIAKDVNSDQLWYVVSFPGRMVAVVRTAIVDVRPEHPR